MCNSIYFVYDSLYHGLLRHIPTHISSNFNKKLQKNCNLQFYKRPGQKHKVICCLKYTGRLLFKISANQGNLAESSLKIVDYLTSSDLIRLSEVQKKTGTKLAHNTIVGRNLGRHLLFYFQIPPHKPLETSSAPVFL